MFNLFSQDPIQFNTNIPSSSASVPQAGAANAAASTGSSLGNVGTQFLNAIPAIASGISSIYLQNQAARMMRRQAQFEQQQIDFQSRLLNIEVAQRARELSKQAAKNSAINQSILAQRGVRTGVGTAAALIEQPFTQAGEDIERLKTKQAFANVGLEGQRAAIGARSSLNQLNRFLNIGETASNVLKSIL